MATGLSSAIYRLRRYSQKRWFFPLLVSLPLVLLTSLRISGSSIGIYSMLDGQKDQAAITKNYRGVRSDEWLVSTQMIIAQSANHFQRVNNNIGNGQDMSLMDAPYKEWSVAFKPQNLAFLVLPLEYAFAFRWWFLGWALVVAAYLFALELFPNKIYRSMLFAVFVGLTPMMFWWWSTDITLCIAYSLFGLWLAMQLVKISSFKTKLFYALVLAYILVSFALILYPPFQIPCIIAAAGFFIGHLLELKWRQNRSGLLKSLLFILAAGAIAGVAVLTFVKTRADAVNLVTHTVYPGKRVELSGGVNPLKSFSSFLEPNLQYDKKNVTGYLGNQSEASNFIFIAPYLVLPSIYLIYKVRRQRHKWLWSLMAANALVLFFLARMYIPAPPLEPFYRLFFLDKVSSTRLLIGAGLAGLFQLAAIFRALDSKVLKPKEVKLMAAFGALSGLAVMLFVGEYTIIHFPVFISSLAKVILFASWVALGIYLLLMRRFIAGLAILAAFSFISVYRINPLYRGLGPLTSSPLITAIKATPNDGNWIVLDDRLLINFPLDAGRHSLNSVQFYPQLGLWHELDPGGQYSKVYNRYAHVVFSDDNKLSAPFKLAVNDSFLVKFEPCQEFLQHNAKYVLAPHELQPNCVKLDQTVTLPAKQYFIYEIVPAH